MTQDCRYRTVKGIASRRRLYYNHSMLQDLITVRDAAQLVGYHPEHVRELLRAGIVKGQKFGETWQVDRVDLLLYVKRQAHSGRKRGPKTGT